MRGTAIRTAAWVLLFAALGVGAAAWFTPTPELEADDAAAVAVDALAAADIDAELVGEPRPRDHRTSDGRTVPVWVVEAETEVDGRSESVELRVQRSAGRLVYVDDRIGADDAERLLTDEQFAVLGAHRDDSLADRWALQNVLAGLSAVAAAGTCYVLATRSAPLWSRP